MRAVDIIRRKRDGHELTAREIAFLIEGFVRGDIPDYQMSAFAMAVLFRGMTDAETAELTLAMARSGSQLDLSGIPGVKVDKHSTGGVGDKTTLVVASLAAAAGVPVAKMSGRGLGHTGGTIDKLESIPGFRTELKPEAFIRQVREIGLAVAGQSGDLAPADKKLYALRDVTATVESIPLIASSVMSKKIAAGADAIVLDVKTGGGAFMKTLEDAERLALAMVAIGRLVGRRTAAVISDMDQPLGRAIGNALEVREAIAALRGEGPEDLTRLCLALAAHMAVLGGRAASLDEALPLLERKLASGEALEKFRRLIAAQGGDPAVVDDPDRLPSAPRRIAVKAERAGCVRRIDAEKLGLAAMMLGAGRAVKDAPIDHSVGIVLGRKIGDRVEAGEALAELHAARGGEAEAEALRLAAEAFEIGDEPPAMRPLILSVVTEEGVRRMDSEER